MPTSHSFYKDPKNSKLGFYEAEVLRVLDGDTIDVRHNYSIYRIRVKGIDAPEMNQPQGWEATLFLKSLIEDKKVYVSATEFGKYDRQVAQIFDRDFKDIGEKMIANGYAWTTSIKEDFSQKFKDLQEEAKAQKVGLWGCEKPIHPKLWRDRKMTMHDKEKKILQEKKKSYFDNNKSKTKTQMPMGPHVPDNFDFLNTKKKGSRFKR